MLRNPIDDDRPALHLRVFERVAGIVDPGDFQLGDVIAIDLSEGGVPAGLPP
jgi:hypothetical protein